MHIRLCAPSFWVHMSQTKPLHPSFIHKKKTTQNGLLAHGVYSSERLDTYECCMHQLTFFTLTSACLADEGAKVQRNPMLWERCTMDSICSTQHVGKVQSILSLPVNIKLFRYSIIPLFRYSVFRVLPSCMNLCALQIGNCSDMTVSILNTKHVLVFSI